MILVSEHIRQLAQIIRIYGDIDIDVDEHKLIDNTQQRRYIRVKNCQDCKSGDEKEDITINIIRKIL